MDAVKEPTDLQQYLTFFVADEEYAMNILRVREIIEYDTLTTIPRAPKWIRGVFNLRGSVVPAVDLAIKFGLNKRPITKTTCIIIVEGQFEKQVTTLGVITDSVSQVVDLSKENILPVPAFGTRIQVGYLLGMVEMGKKFVMVLDAEKVLSSDELLDRSELSVLADSPGGGASSSQRIE